MSTATIFSTCVPRSDVLAGTASDSDFAADLSHVVRGKGGPAQYSDPAQFFANTYPTRGLRNLLANVCTRLTGGSGAVSAIFRLDTSFGGGKTHGLIALVHAARGMKAVAGPSEFIDPALIPSGEVRIAAFDGENADPANGRRMEEGIPAHTPWGEIAYALAGREGYERVRNSDIEGIAPGSDTIAELFGDRPTLILLDELSVYLRKVKNRVGARDQLTAFLTSLFKAVEGSKHATLVYTLAVGKEGRATDAYSEENQFIADKMAEAESVSARKATLLNPTEDDETVHVLRRRLFERIDEAAVSDVVDAYRALWNGQREALSPDAGKPETVAAFHSSYPLHPDVLETFTGKTATLENFQRVRGMLRILGRTVARLWEVKPADATAIHLHHVDPGVEAIRQEIVTRLGQSIYFSALRNDIAGDLAKKSLAQEIDEESHRGLPPYATYVARTIFMHTLAFNDLLKGLSPEHLHYSIIAPTLDISFIENARQRFISRSAYLDDRPGVPLRFLAEANLTQIIRRQEQNVDQGEKRVELNDHIRHIFGGQVFEAVIFPAGPFDVPDEIGNGRPMLAVMSYDACSVGPLAETIPELVARIYERKGAEGISLRSLRNNLVFALADDGRMEDMRHKTAHRMALRQLKAPERLLDLAEHQQAKVRELESRSEQEVAIAIQQCYRHLFYPSRSRAAEASVDLAHSAVDIHSASEKPGSGQQQIVRFLRDMKKLRSPEDDPDAPAYVRDRTPLKKGQITTAALRDEFRRDPALPILIGDDVFIKGVRKGVEVGEYVYQRGELLYGQGDPHTMIAIDEQSFVFTMAYAKEHGIWPRSKPGKVTPPDDGKLSGKGDGGSKEGGLGAEPADGVSTFEAEGPLREALTRVWEQTRAAKVAAIARLTIRMFEAGDAFKLLGIVAGIKSVDQKQVFIDGGYETTGGSTLTIVFRGTPADAQPLKDFLDPQLRAAAEKKLQARFELGFGQGLSMDGDAPEKFSEQMTRFAGGAAYVQARAEATK